MLNAINSSATGDLAGMLDTIAQLPTGSAVANAYQQISPDQASALPALSLAGAMMQWRSLSNRLSYQRWRQGSPPSLTGRRFRILQPLLFPTGRADAGL